MFFIATEEALSGDFFDIGQKIGTAKGKDYYYATGTD
jgi:hypothetical protein